MDNDAISPEPFTAASTGSLRYCADCGAAAYAGDDFCAGCGLRLASPSPVRGGGCALCGAAVRHPVAFYCTQCGASLASSERRLRAHGGDRRTIGRSP